MVELDRDGAAADACQASTSRVWLAYSSQALSGSGPMVVQNGSSTANQPERGNLEVGRTAPLRRRPLISNN